METNQENTGNAMAFETIANMLADIKETVDFIADHQQDEPNPEAISPEMEQKFRALAQQLAALKPSAHFTPEQRTWLAGEESPILAAIRRSAVPPQVIKDLQESLKRIDAFLADPKITAYHKKCFTIDFKNHRAVATILIMGVIILLLGAGNIWQACDNWQYRDNDLKYRWIEKEGGISADGILWIEAFFGYNRVEKDVRNLRRAVEQYEQAVTEQAERIEQARLNQQRADQLGEEAEALKNKK